MVGSRVILPMFGAILGLLFSVIFIWILHSPSTHLVYSFFSVPEGACLVDVENRIPIVLLVLSSPLLGVVVGYIGGVFIDRIGWGDARRR